MIDGRKKGDARRKTHALEFCINATQETTSPSLRPHPQVCVRSKKGPTVSIVSSDRRLCKIAVEEGLDTLTP